MTDPLTAELERIVNDRLQGRVRAFHLAVEGRGLVLRGTARSYYAKQVAQQLVMELTTVPIVANDVEVLSGQQP
jgi:hypothetical protein